MLILLLIALIIYLSVRYFTYYCAFRGLLYYIEIKHSDIPNVEKIEDLTLMAMKRTIKEFFGKKER